MTELEQMCRAKAAEIFGEMGNPFATVICANKIAKAWRDQAEEVLYQHLLKGARSWKRLTDTARYSLKGVDQSLDTIVYGDPGGEQRVAHLGKEFADSIGEFVQIIDDTVPDDRERDHDTEKSILRPMQGKTGDSES